MGKFCSNVLADVGRRQRIRNILLARAISSPVLSPRNVDEVFRCVANARLEVASSEALCSKPIIGYLRRNLTALCTEARANPMSVSGLTV